MRRNAQSGNILFLILLAVVLFAALSYAVTNSTQGGGNSASNEKLDTNAGVILNYATLMEQVVNRMLLTGNCNEIELNFINSQDWSGTNNTLGPPDKHCNVFDPAGGGMGVQTLPNGTGTSGFLVSSINKVVGVGLDSNSELTFVVYNISKPLCLKLNEKLSVPLTAGDAPNDSTGFSGPWPMGGYTPGTRVIADNDNNLIGKRTACFKLSTGDYVFYHVLLAR